MALQAYNAAALTPCIAATRQESGPARLAHSSAASSPFFAGSSKLPLYTAQANALASVPQRGWTAPGDVSLVTPAPRGRRRAAVVSAQASEASKVGPVAVVGGTGFVGTALVKALLAEGEQVRVLTRSVDLAQQAFQGQTSNDALSLVDEAGWAAAIVSSGAVVNLAGTPISTRWSDGVKRDIISSRVETTAKVVAAINSVPTDKRPKVLISTSAVGFYGTSDTAAFDEQSPAGKDFLSEVCLRWESEANRAGTRLAIIRFGIVLEKEGGALGKMLPIFQLFAGGPLGSGQQWMSWVHRDDLVALIIEAMRNTKYEGVVNGTAPNPERMDSFCRQLGDVIGRPSWLPVPGFAIQTLLGEGASVVLDGQQVLPKRTEALGFKYKYPTLKAALSAIFS